MIICVREWRTIMNLKMCGNVWNWRVMIYYLRLQDNYTLEVIVCVQASDLPISNLSIFWSSNHSFHFSFIVDPFTYMICDIVWEDLFGFLISPVTLTLWFSSEFRINVKENWIQNFKDFKEDCFFLKIKSSKEKDITRSSSFMVDDFHNRLSKKCNTFFET